MKFAIKIFIIYLLVFASSSCSEDKSSFNFSRKIQTLFKGTKNVTLSPNEMKEFVVNMDNGLLKSKVIGEVTYSVKYKPVDYIISQELKGSSIDMNSYKQKYSELSGMQYFDLRVEIDKQNGELLKYGLNTVDEYERRVKYLAFDINTDIQLIDGEDTLQCVMNHFERVYDIVPYATILLGFKDNGKSQLKEKTIVFHDKLFGKGIIKFTFLPSDLQNIPHLEVIS